MSAHALPKKVAVLFSGGPAPAANAVITAAASAFRRAGSEVVGFLHGYSGLCEYDGEKRPLVRGKDYLVFEDKDLQGLRNARGLKLRLSADRKSVTLTGELVDWLRSMRQGDWRALPAEAGGSPADRRPAKELERDHAEILASLAAGDERRALQRAVGNSPLAACAETAAAAILLGRVVARTPPRRRRQRPGVQPRQPGHPG